MKIELLASNHSMPKLPCPPESDLNRYLRGMLAESDSSLIETHLSECTSCAEKIDSNHGTSDSLFQTLKETLRTPAPTTADQQTAEIAAVEAAKAAIANRDTGRSGNAESIGAYELVKTLGRGGMGNVYLARHRKLKKLVAIKVLATRHLPDQSELITRFEREIHAAGSLDHPTIVSAHDAGEVDANLFLVMDYIDGLDLSVLVRRVGVMSIADVCGIGVQIALGLSHAHAQGMVHRDIKPSNIMLNQNGEVKILDFGLVLLNPWDEAAGELTTIGRFLGTLDYMSPEQAERSGGVDYRADLYSLGATLFRLLTGRPPLAATPNLSPLEKLRLLADHTPPSLKTLRPDAPSDLVRLVDSLLSTDPRQRPASAANVAEKLEPFAIGADLGSLMKRANSSADATTDVEPVPRLASYFDQNHRGRDTNGWRNWILAAGLVPLAALAGIAIFIATDRGTLRIESDDPDLKVSIARIEKSDSRVDMRVEQSGKDIRLASGEYEIQLANAQSDSIVLERDRVLITRGDKEVVRVTQSDAPPIDSKTSTLVYNGRTYEDWMHTLRTDRRVSTLGQAIQAVVALADDTQQLEAAKACLIPSRRYGSYQTIGGTDVTDYPDNEDGFMNHYENTFENFESKAQLQAIVEELESDHPRSDVACRLLIQRVRLLSGLPSLKEHPNERELWIRLRNQLFEPIPKVGKVAFIGAANTHGVDFALRISRELGEANENDASAIALVARVLASPATFCYSDRESRNVGIDGAWIPIGFTWMIAKMGRLPELPIDEVVRCILGDGDTLKYGFDEDENAMKTLLAMIPETSRSEFCKLTRKYLAVGWRIPVNEAFADFVFRNEADRIAFAKLLREHWVVVKENAWMDGGMGGMGGGGMSNEAKEFYLSLAERLEPRDKPTNPPQVGEVVKLDDSPKINPEAKFNRASFQEWLYILEDDRNPKILCEAIQAVVTLARTDEQASIAAKACLIAARTHGGFVVNELSNFDGAVTPEAVSRKFMGALVKMVPLLAPLPAIQAIDQELKVKNERSVDACKLLLEWHDRLSSNAVVIGSEEGRETLRSIAKSLKSSKTSRNPNFPAHFNEIYRIKAAYWLSESIKDQPDLVAFVRESIEPVANEGSMGNPIMPTILHAAWQIGELSKIPVAKAAAALIGFVRPDYYPIGNSDSRVDKLRDEEIVQILDWYKTSPLFEEMYQALLNQMIVAHRTDTKVIEEFLVDQAPNAKLESSTGDAEEDRKRIREMFNGPRF